MYWLERVTLVRSFRGPIPANTNEMYSYVIVCVTVRQFGNHFKLQVQLHIKKEKEGEKNFIYRRYLATLKAIV